MASLFCQCLAGIFSRLPRKYYLEIYRLKGWEVPDGKIYQKPWVVARYTNEVIYGRFTKDVLQMLQKLNPYVSFCQRRHKHFQWLNSEGKEKVEGYIQDAIGVMEKCTTWYEFRVKHSLEFGVTFQLDLFEDNDSLLD